MLAKSLLAFASDIDIQKMQFQRFTADSGLKIGFINRIIQDKQGFMWFCGKNGLARYDGYEYKLYDSGTESGQISSNIVWDALRDKTGTLWFATSDALNRYNDETDSFTPFEHDKENNYVPSIFEDHKGNIWVATFKGQAKFDVKTENFHFYSTYDEIQDKSKIKGTLESLNDIFQDSKGIFWLATRDSGIVRWDEGTDTYKQYSHSPSDKMSISNNAALVINEDTSGNLWVGTYDGLNLFDREKETFTHFQNVPENSKSLGANVVFDILEDSTGKIWIGTDGGGMNLYHPDSQTFTSFKNNSVDPNSISSNVARDIYEDAHGDLWVGMYPSGVNYFNRLNSVFNTYRNNPLDINSLNSNDVGSVAEDEHGNLWLGTAGGLNYFDRNKNIFRHFENNPKDPGTLKDDDVMKVFYDSKRRLWATTWVGGVHRLDPGAKEFRHYKPIPGDKNSLSHLNVWTILEDQQGQLWFGTQSGLNRYQPETDDFYRFEYVPPSATQSGFDYIWTLVQDDDGYIWAGTESGLFRINPITEEVLDFYVDINNPRGLGSSNVMSIFKDDKNRIWIGTHGGGLNLYHPDTGDFTRYDVKNGLPSNSIQGILSDKQGNLWISSAEGLAKFNPKTEEVIRYNKSNGLQGNEFSLAAISSQRGELIFGGRNGFNIFFPENIKPNTSLAREALTEMKIANVPVKIGQENSPIEKALNHTDAITLTAEQAAIFSFKYSALIYRLPEKTQYAYMMEGFDNRWHNVGDQRIATYTNLNPGDYTFHVKAANNEGVWNETGSSIKVKILPPWWATWWAYTIYALIVIGQIAKIFYTQHKKRKQVEEQNRILETKVAARTQALRHKNEEMRALLANMRQGLFTCGEAGIIQAEYSQYLESIFETQDIAGRDVTEFIFGEAQLSEEIKAINENVIHSVLGEAELSFTFNSHLLAQEYNAKIGEKIKHLSLDWNPILADGIVNKLMVTVRDVTKLRYAEIEAQKRTEELNIIGQIINTTASAYLNFEKSAIKQIKKCKPILENHKKHNKGAIEEILRSLHTIKGNARTVGFSYICDITHNAESKIGEIVTNPELDFNLIAEAVEKVADSIEEYSRVFHVVLERDEVGEHQRDNFVGKIAKSKIKQCLDVLKAKVPALSHEKEYQTLETIIDDSNTMDLKLLLESICESLPSIAADLKKPPPKTLINTAGLAVSEDAQHLITDVFTHIIRNSIDHGIELPSLRKERDKPEQGKISIQAALESNNLKIQVSDDGQGIDIARLYSKGLENNYWGDQDKTSSEEIANTIFKSGVSTKTEISDISGRGVGLDAVKAFLNEIGGDITIRLLKENPHSKNHQLFEFVILLPLQAIQADSRQEKHESMPS